MKEIADYKPIIIGVDYGYGNIKTEHCVFPSGVERTGAAIADNHLLEYDGKKSTGSTPNVPNTASEK